MKPLDDHKLGKVLKDKFETFSANDLDQHFETIYQQSISPKPTGITFYKAALPVLMTFLSFVPYNTGKVLVDTEELRLLNFRSQNPIQYSLPQIPNDSLTFKASDASTGNPGETFVFPDHPSPTYHQPDNNQERLSVDAPIVFHIDETTRLELPNHLDPIKTAEADVLNNIETKRQHQYTSMNMGNGLIPYFPINKTIPVVQRKRYLFQIRSYLSFSTISPNKRDEVIIKRSPTSRRLLDRVGVGVDFARTITQKGRLHLDLGVSMDYEQYGFQFNTVNYTHEEIIYTSRKLLVGLVGQLRYQIPGKHTIGVRLLSRWDALTMMETSPLNYTRTGMSYGLFYTKKIHMGQSYLDIGPYYQAALHQATIGEIALSTAHIYGIVINLR